jgi:colanic acid/amylovoran biosynthesis protein
MKKYLIVGVSIRSRGGEAMVFEACKKIKEIDEDNEISMATSNFHYDSNFLNKVRNPYKITTLDLASSRHSRNRYINFGLNLAYSLYDTVLVLLNNKLLKYLNLKLNYKNKLIKYINGTDIIIQIAGISFTENFGIFSAMNWAKLMLLSRIMNKKYFCLPQSYGPSGKLIKFFAKFGLNRVTHMMPRGKKSIDYLNKLNLKNKNITFVPDLAFSYDDPTELKNGEIYKKFDIDRSKKYVGVIFNTHEVIIKLFSKVIDHLIDNYNYNAILIAHEVNEDNIIDDRFVNNLIYETCVNKINILNITDELRANEIKSLIKLCDFTICSRFHGMISSLKMEVPPLIIGWADKYHEIMELFDLENLVMDYRDLNKDKIIKKIDFLLDNKLSIVDKIDKNLSKYKNSSEIMKEIIEQNL